MILAPASIGWGAADSGISYNTSSTITSGMVSYVQLLRSRIPLSVLPVLTVTSGERTPESQASAMLTKLNEGGTGELYKTYANDSAITELLALPRDASAWAAKIRELSGRGIRLSRHLWGGSIDLHTRTLSSTQIAAIQAAVAATGGSYLLEGAPPHLHVDLPAAYVVKGAIATGAKFTLNLWLWSSVVGAVILLGVAYNQKQRRRAQEAA